MSGDVSIFMCYGDVRGDAQTPADISKSPASGGWMRLLAVEFAGFVSYGQRTASHKEGSETSPVRITKETDSSSTGMLRNALFGEHDKGVAIVFLRTGDGQAPQEFLRIELTNAGISDFTLEGGGDDRSVETYALSYAEMEIISWIHDGAARGAHASVLIQNRA